jgi:hypothetical protein
MDARPILLTLARVLDEAGLEAVMIGNAAAALHGAPVTTLDFEALRSRASRIDFGGHVLMVADLADIIRSKRAAGRPRDRAVLEILEKALDEKKKSENDQA